MSDALAAWSPQLRIFLRRSLIFGAITVVVLALAGWGIGVMTGYWQIAYVAPVLALTYSWGVDDPARWRAARQNRWYLRTDAIINHGPDGEARIPLADVTEVRTRFGWSVILFLKGGQRVRIAYVPEPSDIAAQIEAARARLLP